MDLVAIRRLRCTLTVHFAVIACLTAMLVAAGSQSFFLPILIFFVSLAGYVFVDRLEWFELGRIGSYVGMLAVTTFSIFSYFYNAFSIPSESGQLMAIAGLLVYPEAVLFLQAKNLRVFEQLAVFLLLEMIVAALVNDNILFGVLLAPIMLLWVSSLFIFSRYATIVQIDPNMERPLPILFEVLLARFRKSFLREPAKPNVVTSRAALSDVQSSRGLRRTLQSVPIGVGAVIFAAFFFYLLPRTSLTSFEPSLGFESRVGLPKTLSIGTVGRLLADPTPVLRMTLRDYKTGTPYTLNEAPYIRARVMDTYGAASRERWATYGEWTFGGMPEYRRLRGLDSTGTGIGPGRDLVNIEFDIKRRFAGTMFAIPPAFASRPSQNLRLNYDSLNMVLEELDQSKLPRGKSMVYTIGSSGFANQSQLRLTPSNIRFELFGSSRTVYSLTGNFRIFERCNQYREELLAQSGVNIHDSYAVATLFEQHFGNGKFTYTLDLRPPVDADLDPIEDFLLNQRRGHCQYFASAMVMMLRQSGIPCRIVVGYRPREYNKLGNYFPVRQSDAHAWVEALFSHEALRGTDQERWLTDSESYWVRFDPTAFVDSEGAEIVEQQGQAIDYAEKLWKDYVVEGQKLSGDDNLYAPVAANSENAYDQMVETFRNFKQNLEQGRFLVSAGNIGFKWQLTIAIIVGGTFAIFIWRMLVLLPKFAPQLARKLGILRERPSVQQAFFAKCLRLLASQGYVRDLHETPSEFTQRASREILARHATSYSSLDRSLEFVTNIYYRLRFGQDGQLKPDEQQCIDQTLEELAKVKANTR